MRSPRRWTLLALAKGTPSSMRHCPYRSYPTAPHPLTEHPRVCSLPRSCCPLAGITAAAATEPRHHHAPSLAPPQPRFRPPSDPWWDPSRTPPLPRPIPRRPRPVPPQTQLRALDLSRDFCSNQGHSCKVLKLFKDHFVNRFFPPLCVLARAWKNRRNSRKNQKNAKSIFFVCVIVFAWIIEISWP
jgi:hypothetical protein